MDVRSRGIVDSLRTRPSHAGVASTASLSPAFPLAWSSERLTGTRTALVAVAGELDRTTAPALRDHLEWWLGRGCTRIVLDTANVTFADVGAFDVLRTIGRRALARHGYVVLSPAGSAMRRMVELLGPAEGVDLAAW